MSSAFTDRIEENLKQAASASQDEKWRLWREVNRLGDKTKRRREEADRLEAEAKRLRTRHAEVSHLHESLEFEALCLALRRNDASTTCLTGHPHFPAGYAKGLGNALLQNARVTDINIDLERTTPCVDTFRDLDNSDVETYVNPLVKFVRTSSNLRSVTLFGDSHKSLSLAELFLAACLQNCHIDYLVLRLHTLPARAFRDCLVSQSLEVLNLSVSGLVSYSLQELQMIGSAFQSLTSLMILEKDSPDGNVIETILAALSQSECKLEELNIECRGGATTPRLWSTVQELLFASKNLKELLLGFFRFNAEKMEGLVEWLSRQDVSTSMLSMLTFGDCIFDRDAKRLLRDYCHTIAEAQNGISVPNFWSLRELAFSSAWTRRKAFSAQTLVSLLCKQREQGGREWVATFGSKIRSVKVDCFPGFLEHLAENSHRICLESLDLGSLETEQDCAALSKCISGIESLRTLQIDMTTVPRSLLGCLRQNRNIQSFSTNSASILAQAYCDRNQFLDALLLKTTHVESDSVIRERRGIAMSPALMEVATQVQTSRAPTMLRTLLHLRDFIGPL